MLSDSSGRILPGEPHAPKRVLFVKLRTVTSFGCGAATPCREEVWEEPHSACLIHSLIGSESKLRTDGDSDHTCCIVAKLKKKVALRSHDRK